jgi:hypothetical protein
VRISAILPWCHAADELDVEGPHAQRAARGLTHGSERFGDQVVEGFALREAGAEFRGLALELLVTQRFEGLFQRVRTADIPVVAVQQPLVAAPEQLGKPIRHGRELRKGTGKAGYCTRGRFFNGPR